MNRVLKVTLATAALGLVPAFAQQVNVASPAAISPAGVSPFTVSIGTSFIGGGMLNLGFSANNLTSVAGLPLSGRVSADALGTANAAVAGDALVNIPLNPVNLYLGPGLGYSFAGGGLFGDVVAGATLPVFSTVGVYAEGVYRNYFTALPSSLGARVGVNISF